MHGTRGSRPPVRRYLCSTRRYGGECAQPITKAEPLENQLVEWLHGFQPDAELRALLLDTIAGSVRDEDGDAIHRGELTEQLRRLQDIYVLGDLTKAQYVMRRQALQDELERLEPPTDPLLDEAEELLAGFAGFWEIEAAPAERYRLLATIFEQVWQDNGLIVAVKPRATVARYFQTASQTPKRQSGLSGVKSGSDGTRTRTFHPHPRPTRSKSGACRRGLRTHSTTLPRA
jgi:hypothetical protein